MSNNDLIDEMIKDFELERQELIRMRQLGESSERIGYRLKVIDESVGELKKQLSDSSRMSKQAKGGYEPEEIKRFYENVDPVSYRTELNPNPPSEFYAPK
jgi:hypothetical protein